MKQDDFMEKPILKMMPILYGVVSMKKPSMFCVLYIFAWKPEEKTSFNILDEWSVNEKMWMLEDKGKRKKIKKYFYYLLGPQDIESNREHALLGA